MFAVRTDASDDGCQVDHYVLPDNDFFALAHEHQIAFRATRNQNFFSRNSARDERINHFFPQEPRASRHEYFFSR